METTTDKDDSLVYASSEPNIKELIHEYERCSPIYRGWNRLDDSDNVRFCRWEGQNVDGKKHSVKGVKAQPWENASDCRIYLADSIISENVALMIGAFWRSVMRATGVEASDMEQSGHITKLFQWLTDTKLNRELVREVELSAQYFEAYGIAAIHVTWTRELCCHRRRVTMRQLVEGAMADPSSPLAQLPQLIMDPAAEPQAVALIKEQAAEIINAHFASVLQGEPNDALDEWEMSDKRARKFVRDMRNEESAELPLPYFAKNQPLIQTLRPYYDVFFPTYVTDIQKAPVVFHRIWLSEVDVRALAKVENWNQEWVEAACKKAGEQSAWVENFAGSDSARWEFSWQSPEASQHQLIEVIYAYSRQLDEDDVPTIYYTVFHAGVKAAYGEGELYAIHRPLGYEHKMMPFIVGQREILSRNIHMSRGVPEIVMSRQRELKVHRDALIDLTSIAVCPPLNVYDNGMGVAFLFGPAAQNAVSPGREPHMLEIPTRGAPVAFEVSDRIEREVNNDFGRLSADVPPTRSQTKQQAMVTKFLLMWSETLQQVFQVLEQFMPDAEFQRVTGSEKPLPKGLEISQQPDFTLSVDVRDMDMEQVKLQFQAINEGVIPLDSEQVINRGKLVRAQLRTINPSLAKEVSNSPNEGAAQVMQKVQKNLILILSGMDPELGEDDDPTAATQQQMLQQVIGASPALQKKLMSDTDAQAKLQQWEENLQFNQQQAANKQIGRTGVNQQQQAA